MPLTMRLASQKVNTIPRAIDNRAWYGYYPPMTNSSLSRSAARRRSWTAIAGAGVLVWTLAGCAAPVAGEPPSPPQTQAASNPEPTPEVPIEEQIAALAIPAGLDNETVAQRYAELSTAWWNAGKTDNFVEDYMAFSEETGRPNEEYYDELGKTNAELYGPAMYGPSWNTDPALQAIIQERIEANIANLKAYNMTAFNDDPANIEGFKTWYQVDRVRPISSDENSRSLELTMSTDDNSELNTVPDGSVSESGIITLSLIVVDGKEYVTHTP